MSRHRLSLLDRLRGWHWQGTTRIRNFCGCEL